jgi:putative tryptophan/tyrosine transport system substrate-binding protein
VERRHFLTALGGAVTWPLIAVHGQPSKMPLVGFLGGGSLELFTEPLSKLRFGLAETGFAEGQNVRIEYRWAHGQFGRLPELATELVGLNAEVIVATGGSAPAQAAHEATSIIPIVFTSGDDPIKLGFVQAINHPGSNMTGVSLFTGQLTAKRLELLHELAPKTTKIAFLLDPTNPTAGIQISDARAAAKSVGLEVHVLPAKTESEIESAFAQMDREHLQALLVGDSPFFVGGRDRLISLAARYTIPTIYQWREYVLVGGLISYGTSLAAAYHQMGVYVGRILQGEKPADLPVVQPSVFELVVNLKTAKVLGITIPQTVLVGADELIQ